MKLVTKSWTKLLTMLVTITAFGLMMGCATSQDGMPAGVEQDIPNDANRIVLQQTDVPPADVYVDMINLLQLKDWTLTYSEENLDTDNLEGILENEPLVFSAKKQINNNLALHITGNVEATPEGGQMIASVKYSDNVDTPVGEWQNATWTSGKSQTAFFEGLEAVRSARYDAMNFEVGVMVETDEQQAAG